MVVGRLLGWIIVLCGIIVLGRDLIATWDRGSFAPIVLGQLWYDLHPASLQLLQPAIQRHIHPALWDGIIQPLLLWWAFPVLIVLGLLLLLLCRRRRRDWARRRRRIG